MPCLASALVLAFGAGAVWALIHFGATDQDGDERWATTKPDDERTDS